MRCWWTTLTLLLVVSGLGCAGPAKLAEKSEDKLAQGDMWKAWTLATRALDKAPANARARQAAASAAATISEDWQRRIVALTAVDSSQAAEQVLQFIAFRTGAIRYTTVGVTPAWAATEMGLRTAEAQRHYAEGLAAAKSKRPKRACLEFTEATRFAGNYRDADRRAEQARAAAQTTVAVLPLRSAAGDELLAHEVAVAWNGALAEHLPNDVQFTRLVPLDDVKMTMRISDLGHTTRLDAIRLATQAHADRVVWGTIGPVESRTGVSYFRHPVWRRVTVKDETGSTVTRWTEVPIHVIARTRTVEVNLTYEVISTRDRTTLASESLPRRLAARALWTAYLPDDAAEAYALVTDDLRRTNPEHCRRIESEWAAVVGAGTTLAEVLEARRASVRRPIDRATAVARYAAGSAFVVLEDLPSAQELAEGALVTSWPSVHRSLVQLDTVDDVDFGRITTNRPEE